MGRPPSITQKQAVRATLDIIDENGLDSLSLEAVARRLGIKAPSLYHHFADRADLLDAVARHIMSRVALLTVDDDSDWRDSVVDLCAATRGLILEHPNAAPLLLRTVRRQSRLAVYEHWLKQLAKVGAPPECWQLILGGLENFTYGTAILEAGEISKSIPDFGSFDADEFPSVATAISANTHDSDELFRLSVRAFLDGVAQQFA